MSKRISRCLQVNDWKDDLTDEIIAEERLDHSLTRHSYFDQGIRLDSAVNPDR